MNVVQILGLVGIVFMAWTFVTAVVIVVGSLIYRARRSEIAIQRRLFREKGGKLNLRLAYLETEELFCALRWWIFQRQDAEEIRERSAFAVWRILGMTPYSEQSGMVWNELEKRFGQTPSVIRKRDKEGPNHEQKVRLARSQTEELFFNFKKWIFKGKNAESIKERLAFAVWRLLAMVPYSEHGKMVWAELEKKFGAR